MSNIKKDDLPAMPFYVGDWLKAPDIQCLSYELKGLWFEMLCYMWESKERGYLLYTHEELSRLLRLPQNLLEQKMIELRKKDIFSVRVSDGAIYSRRMVRDQEIRVLRTNSGSLGGRRTFARHFASDFAQAKTKAQCENENESENESESIKKVVFNFDEVWGKYPAQHKDGKKAAERSFRATVKSQEEMTAILQALENYLKSEKVQKGFIKNGSTWFNNWRDWVSYVPPAQQEAKPPAEMVAATCRASRMDKLQTKAELIKKGYTEHRADEAIMTAWGDRK